MKNRSQNGHGCQVLGNNMDKHAAGIEHGTVIFKVGAKVFAKQFGNGCDLFSS